jgi:hypothetical protein
VVNAPAGFIGTLPQEFWTVCCVPVPVTTMADPLAGFEKASQTKVDLESIVKGATQSMHLIQSWSTARYDSSGPDVCSGSSFNDIRKR